MPIDKKKDSCRARRWLVLSVALLSESCAAAARERQVEARVAEAVRVEHGPRMDGTLNDPLWQTAKAIVDFRQREPHEEEPATEKTEVRILYTRHAVYFGILCFDAAPSRIIATELRRDVSQDLDDHFEILIDSNHDRRGAYVFEVNPLGTQNDGLIVEEQGDTNGGDFDRGWEGVWTSEARITPDGWTATIEIPFTTLCLAKTPSAFAINSLEPCLPQVVRATTQACYTLSVSYWPRLFAFSARTGTSGSKTLPFGSNWPC